MKLYASIIIKRLYGNFANDGKTVSLFIFNHIIPRFGVPKELFTDHGSHFQNKMIIELV